MNEVSLRKMQIYITIAAAIFAWTMLAYWHFNGGVPVHHILKREDLPGFSNWWAGILLPLFTWITAWRIRMRIKKLQPEEVNMRKVLRNIALGFVAAVLFGAILSFAFTNEYNDFLNYQVDSLLIIFFLVPVFRSEYLLGLIFGMTITFGPVIPTGFALVVALISLVVYKYLRPLLGMIVKLARGKSLSSGG